MAPSQLSRPGGVRRRLPARRHRAHRPARPRPAVDAGVPVRAAAPPRWAGPNHAAEGGARCGATSPEGRRLLAAGLLRAGVAADRSLTSARARPVHPRRPRRGRDAARRGRLGGRVPPRHLAAAQAAGHHHQRWPALPPQEVALRSRHPALAAPARQTMGASAAVLRCEYRFGERQPGCPHPLQRVPDRRRRRPAGRRRPAVAGALPGLGDRPDSRARGEEVLRQRDRAVTPHDPPTRLGRHPARHGGTAARRLPVPARAGLAAARRARHGPNRVIRQPRSMAGPGLPAGDLGPRPLRPAALQCPHPGLRLSAP